MTDVAPRLNFIDLHPAIASLEEEVVAGLARNPKQLPPKLFYDARGSKLFEEITRLPEYYLTRTEMGILEGAAAELAAELLDGSILVELGSGSSAKVGLLLDQARARDLTYMPVDLSATQLREAAERLADERPSLRVVALCTDYSSGFEIPNASLYSRRLLFFPGSTVGNFEPAEAKRFLSGCRAALVPGDSLVMGVDLRKDPLTLNAAYNDAAGVTAEFNLNLLRRINRELGSDFQLEQFAHEAHYDEEAGRIEMHLRSLVDQEVHLGGRTFRFAAGETIHTENSYKYSLAGIRSLGEEAGFKVERVLLDEGAMFTVQLFRAV
jgi:dimethylhistidine N-methyltransferase